MPDRILVDQAYCDGKIDAGIRFSACQDGLVGL